MREPSMSLLETGFFVDTCVRSGTMGDFAQTATTYAVVEALESDGEGEEVVKTLL
jgi:hypothetical protein